MAPEFMQKSLLGAGVSFGLWGANAISRHKALKNFIEADP